MKPVIVLTTVGDNCDARAIASALVEQRLAACVSIIPNLHSSYRWQGRVEQDSEQLLLIKSAEERLPELKEAIFARHPYEVPEFLVVAVDAIEGPYRQWLMDSIDMRT